MDKMQTEKLETGSANTQLEAGYVGDDGKVTRAVVFKMDVRYVFADSIFPIISFGNSLWIPSLTVSQNPSNPSTAVSLLVH